jgi:hypothetical protein
MTSPKDAPRVGKRETVAQHWDDSVPTRVRMACHDLDEDDPAQVAWYTWMIRGVGVRSYRADKLRKRVQRLKRLETLNIGRRL